MLSLFEKDTLIRMHLQGFTQQEIAKELKISRPTVSKYVKQYEKDLQQLQEADTVAEKEEIIIRSSSAPKYSTVNRKKIKLIPEVEEIIRECLEANDLKRQRGMRKMIMRNTDIHELILSKNYSISYRTVCHHIAMINQKAKETYIRQEYPEGKSAEFDWGDVTLYIEEIGCERRYKIGLFTLKHSDFRFAGLYSNENTESFMDIHTKFFDYIGGVTEEVVYDNALVQVQRLAGRQKKPTEAVLRLSNYYGYQPRYTNYYSGNEKGHVERSVEVIRRKAFSRQHRFETIADAEAALLEAVKKENARIKQRTEKSADAVFAEEQKYLKPNRIPLDVTQIICCKVDKYSFIYVDCNFYSVPDYLTHKEVSVHKGVNSIKVYHRNQFLFETKRILGRNQYKIDIHHYLDTLKKKPGAIAQSLALKQSIPWLQQIFNDYYITNPKDFIYFLELMDEFSLNKVKIATESVIQKGLPLTTSYIKNQLINTQSIASKVIMMPSRDSITDKCQDQLSAISMLYNQGGI